MAGKRMLHSNICESKKLSEISFAAETLYYRLITRADDDGNFSADARIVLGQCVPLRKELDEKKVLELLEELATVTFGEKKALIQYYTKDGDKYLHITRFEDFQYLRPDRTATVKFPTHPARFGTSLVNQRYTNGTADAGHCQPQDKISKDKINLSKDNIPEFKNLARRFRSHFKFKAGKRPKEEQDYRIACEKYPGGEDWVLAKFDEWAPQNMWVAEKLALFPLSKFYEDLEEAFDAENLAQEREGPKEDLTGIQEQIEQSRVLAPVVVERRKEVEREHAELESLKVNPLVF